MIFRQLYLPGMEPDESLFFEEGCGCFSRVYTEHEEELSDHVCEHSRYLAIWSTLGLDVSTGYETPHQDSLQVFACSREHLLHLIKIMETSDMFPDFQGTLPEIIFNGKGEIERGLCKIIHGEDYLSAPAYSSGKETVEQFWEKHKDGFV